MRDPGVLILGDINIDLLARLEAGIEWAGCNLAPELRRNCGGVGANTALALARWGVPARLMGCIGQDWFGHLAVDFLRSGGVDVSFVQQTDGAPTGLCFIAITPGGQRTMFGSRGANALLQPPQDSWSCLEGVAAVHLIGHTFLSQPAAQAAEQLLEEARKRSLRVSLDVGMAPSRQVSEKILQVIRKVEILFIGRDEAFGLYRKQDQESVLGALQECGAREQVMKLGEKGCLFFHEQGWREVPAIPVKSCDTTGAGDAFAAAYLRARLHGWAQEEAALLGNAAGAAAASVIGAAESMPAPEQVLQLLETNHLPAPGEPLRRQVAGRLRAALDPAAASGILGGKHGASG